ncbi:hypothetical protein [uncultured Clostridium sp.]|uniref:hypothetical protein n=1 Tax=uncultured Clostridium sp. TaxID=59620 RepID=UPI0025FB3540|nr:hypothetical protein [uncultured Clostridium sp.]
MAAFINLHKILIEVSEAILSYNIILLSNEKVILYEICIDKGIYIRSAIKKLQNFSLVYMKGKYYGNKRI